MRLTGHSNLSKHPLPRRANTPLKRFQLLFEKQEQIGDEQGEFADLPFPTMSYKSRLSVGGDRGEVQLLESAAPESV